jgi:hypothetical protein
MCTQAMPGALFSRAALIAQAAATIHYLICGRHPNKLSPTGGSECRLVLLTTCHLLPLCMEHSNRWHQFGACP